MSFVALPALRGGSADRRRDHRVGSGPHPQLDAPLDQNGASLAVLHAAGGTASLSVPAVRRDMAPGRSVGAGGGLAWARAGGSAILGGTSTLLTDSDDVATYMMAIKYI